MSDESKEVGSQPMKAPKGAPIPTTAAENVSDDSCTYGAEGTINLMGSTGPDTTLVENHSIDESYVISQDIHGPAAKGIEALPVGQRTFPLQLPLSHQTQEPTSKGDSSGAIASKGTGEQGGTTKVSQALSAQSPPRSSSAVDQTASARLSQPETDVAQNTTSRSTLRERKLQEKNGRRTTPQTANPKAATTTRNATPSSAQCARKIQEGRRKPPPPATVKANAKTKPNCKETMDGILQDVQSDHPSELPLGKKEMPPRSSEAGAKKCARVPAAGTGMSTSQRWKLKLQAAGSHTFPAQSGRNHANVSTLGNQDTKPHPRRAKTVEGINLTASPTPSISTPLPTDLTSNVRSDTCRPDFGLFDGETEHHNPGAFHSEGIGHSCSFCSVVSGNLASHNIRDDILSAGHDCSRVEIVATLVDDDKSIVQGVATPMEGTFKLFMRDRWVQFCAALITFVIAALAISLLLVFMITDSETPDLERSAVLSFEPTFEPTPHPVDCSNVTVEVTCQSTDGRSCEQIFSSAVECAVEDIYDIHAKFTGKRCSHIYNSSGIFAQCEDFDEGPPKEGVVYIKVTAGRNHTIYFEGPVKVGNDFHLNNNGRKIQRDMTVTITEGSLAGGRLLQRLSFFSSFSTHPFCSDYFDFNTGNNLQIVGFTGKGQAPVTRFFQSTYTYSIKNQGETNLRLVGLVSTRNGDSVDHKDNVQDIIVSNDIHGYTFEENTVVDMTLSYTAAGILTALSEQNDDCDVQSEVSVVASPSRQPTIKNDRRCAGLQRCITYFGPGKAPTMSPSLSLQPS